MLESVNTPILIIGFNRPETLKAQLNRVEELDARTVWVSLDGPRGADEKILTDSCRAAVLLWSQRSKHNIVLKHHETNLGIYNHSLLILRDFFKQFEVGLVLEDDIEFRSEFVSYIDKHSYELSSGKYWSICGHNPASDLTRMDVGESIFFGPSHIHTVWGWAAHRNTVQKFVSAAGKFSDNFFQEAIDRGAHSISKDPLYRLGFKRVWTRKIRRASDGNLVGGWDNFWVTAGWHSGLPSLLPAYSLSREDPFQDEGQTHSHETIRTQWEKINWKLDTHTEIKSRLTVSDVRISRVWGISRLYCWFYFFRLLRSQ